jgi:hypothetical protein
MVNPLVAVAVGGQVLGGVMGAKGLNNAARAAQQVAEYNAQVAENEAVVLQRAKVDEEANLRKQSDRLKATQRVATAASGIQMSGSPLQALADTYFNTEKDAARIQYASSIEQMQKESEASLTRAEGRAQATALRFQAQQSLLSGFTGGAQTYGTLV